MLRIERMRRFVVMSRRDGCLKRHMRRKVHVMSTGSCLLASKVVGASFFFFLSVFFMARHSFEAVQNRSGL